MCGCRLPQLPTRCQGSQNLPWWSPCLASCFLPVLWWPCHPLEPENVHIILWPEFYIGMQLPTVTVRLGAAVPAGVRNRRQVGMRETSVTVWKGHWAEQVCPSLSTAGVPKRGASMGSENWVPLHQEKLGDAPSVCRRARLTACSLCSSSCRQSLVRHPSCLHRAAPACGCWQGGTRDLNT